MKRTGPVIIAAVAACILPFVPVNGLSAERPEIIRHDVTRLDSGLNFTIMWQSANPVTHIVISAGREQKDIRVDVYDNRRNPDGYSGEISALVPVDGSAGVVQYAIFAEDDIRLRSEPLAGKIGAPQQAMVPSGHPHGHHQDENWGKEVLKPMPSPGQQEGSAGTVGDIVGKLMEAYDRHDGPPDIKPVKVNAMSGENASFSTRAMDDKGLREVRFKVLDDRGNLVGVQVLTNLGRVWDGTSRTFQLGGGKFKAVAQAIDTAGNTSKEETAAFELGGQPRELAVVQEPPITAGAAPQAQTAHPPDQQQNFQQQNIETNIYLAPQIQQPAATQQQGNAPQPAAAEPE